MNTNQIMLTLESLSKAEKRAERAEARAAELESERERWIAKLQAYDDLERANADLAKRLEQVTTERDALKRSLSEALNSGNGAYRP